MMTDQSLLLKMIFCIWPALDMPLPTVAWMEQNLPLQGSYINNINEIESYICITWIGVQEDNLVFQLLKILLKSSWILVNWVAQISLTMKLLNLVCIPISTFNIPKIKSYGCCTVEGLEHSTPSMGVMSSNPRACTWSWRPNSCEEMGLSDCSKVLRPYRWPGIVEPETCINNQN